MVFVSVPGWNDPPQFSHISLDSHGIKNSKLNKRPAPHSHPSPLTPSSLSPLGPPPSSSSSAPPIHKLEQSIDTCSVADTSLCRSQSDDKKESSGVAGVNDSRVEEDYSGVVEGFQAQLERHKSFMTVSE